MSGLASVLTGEWREPATPRRQATTLVGAAPRPSLSNPGLRAVGEKNQYLAVNSLSPSLAVAVARSSLTSEEVHRREAGERHPHLGQLQRALSLTTVEMLQRVSRDLSKSIELVRSAELARTVERVNEVMARANVENLAALREVVTKVGLLFSSTGQIGLVALAPLSVAQDHPLTRDAYAALLAQVGPSQRVQGQAILDEFCMLISGAHPAAAVPPLHTATADDGAFLIEWIFSDRRLGFSLEPTPEESGWYFVRSHGSSERFEAGTLDQLELPRLVELALRK